MPSIQGLVSLLPEKRAILDLARGSGPKAQDWPRRELWPSERISVPSVSEWRENLVYSGGPRCSTSGDMIERSLPSLMACLPLDHLRAQGPVNRLTSRRGSLPTCRWAAPCHPLFGIAMVMA